MAVQYNKSFLKETIFFLSGMWAIYMSEQKSLVDLQTPHGFQENWRRKTYGGPIIPDLSRKTCTSSQNVFSFSPASASILTRIEVCLKINCAFCLGTEAYCFVYCWTQGLRHWLWLCPFVGSSTCELFLWADTAYGKRLPTNTCESHIASARNAFMWTRPQ